MRQVNNPSNRFSEITRTYLLENPPTKTEVIAEECKSALSKNQSPDLGFDFSINPYRGCYHACAYCYARPSHQYLDLGAGTDFDTKIIAKKNIAKVLKAEFMNSKWQGHKILLSGNTDCYQPAEAKLQLTRAIIKVCLEFQNSLGIITKSNLIQRDIDLLSQLNQNSSVSIHISLGFIDEKMARAIEPFAPSPRRRLETIKTLADAGLNVGILMAPMIPGLNDDQVANILTQAKEAGATTAEMIPIRLPAEVKEIFFMRLAKAYPLRVNKVKRGITEMRAGKLYDSRFFYRMQGYGNRYKMTKQLFDKTKSRLGLEKKNYSYLNNFSRPGEQLPLF